MSWRVDKDRALSYVAGGLLTILFCLIGWMGQRLQAQVDTNTTDISAASKAAGVDHEAIQEIRERTREIEHDVKDLTKAVKP